MLLVYALCALVVAVLASVNMVGQFQFLNPYFDTASVFLANITMLGFRADDLWLLTRILHIAVSLWIMIMFLEILRRRLPG